MKIFKMLIIFLPLIFMLQCSNDGITNIEFNPTDHPITKISEEMIISIIISENHFYSFSDDSTMLNCQGDGCNDYYIKTEEMNSLVKKLSDTNYFHWEFMTAVTPYPATDCNLLIYGKDNEGNQIDYMCTIGRGNETSKILLELSESLSGKAHTAFVEIANYYKQ
ncbi:MAG: hypothetical protein P8Z35_25705 [Ignavibacteriaceae bacterium]